MPYMCNSVSFIVPAFNEETSIFEVLINLNQTANKMNLDYEIIVVDDGSTDKTQIIVEDFFSSNPHCGFILKNETNRGYGFALKRGAKSATKDCLFFYDADGQHRNDQIELLLKEWTDNSKLIIGRRNLANTSPQWRKPGKALIKWTAEAITRARFPDLFSGFRLWDRQTFASLSGILPDGFSISTTSTIASHFVGIPLQWVTITVDKRVGKSTATLADGFRILLLLIRIVSLFAPLRVFFPVSFLLSLLGVYYTILSYMNSGASSLRGLIVFLIALIIALQGLVIDQISALRRGEKVSSKSNG